jgi:choice-of-anchor B domain-containing protein
MSGHRTALVIIAVMALTISLVGAAFGHPEEPEPPANGGSDPGEGDGVEPDPGTRGRPGVPVPDDANRPARHAPCVQGTAYVAELDAHPILQSGAFACDRIDLLSFLTVDELGGGLYAPNGRGSDVWGWTDPETGREYVLAGLEVGTAIVDITDPKRPVHLAHLPTAGSNNVIWRDIKVYADHAFIVAEALNHGMQVLDLSVLRTLDAASGPHTLTADAHYTGFLRAHNLVINEDSGFAYAVGHRDDQEGCLGSGMHMIDVRDPLQPTYAGCYAEDGYVHDAHCVIYDGPDTRFTDSEICIAASPNAPTGHTMTIVDVSDKTDPQTLSITGYDNPAYSHQGWLLDGHRYYLHNSETVARDPQGLEIFDLASLTDPQHIGFFENPAQSTQHNLYQASDGFVYQSNYSSGLRMYDVSGVADGTIQEVGYFDVYPPNDAPGFGFGTWSNYPFFESGVVAVHGYQGLWLVKPRR